MGLIEDGATDEQLEAEGRAKELEGEARIKANE